MRDGNANFGSTAVVLAALVVLLAGLRAATDIVTPFLIAVFVATLTWPLVSWLHRLRVPKAFAVLAVMCGVIGIITLVGSVAANSLDEFNQNFPAYQQKLEAEVDAATRGLQEFGRQFGLEFRTAEIWEELDLGSAAGIAGSTLLRFGNVLTKTFLIVLTVLFMLLEAFRLPAKLSEALGSGNKTRPGFEAFAKSVQRYLAVRTATSLATGLCAGLWTWLLDVDYPVFWGLLAFLFNYVPNIGSFVAAVPAVLMAIVQYGGGVGLLVAAGYMVINIGIGGVIEPHFMGDSVGLSPLIVLISLIFWGWVFGAVGMLLSTPLTISVKIALENYPETRWIATLAGSGKA